MNYYQHHIGDYRRDTAHLSLLEHGAYRQLLDMYYLSEEPIPEETEVVFRRLCARTDDEKNAVLTVLKEFFKLENGWIQTRCNAEIEAYKSKADRARNNGKLGGRPIKTKEVISGNQEVTKEKANHKPITNNQEPLINTPHTPKGGKSVEKRKSGIALQTYLENCKEESKKPIPEDDSVFSYASDIGLPIDFLQLQWREFKDRYTQPGAKRYTAWPIVFGKSVRGNWFKLWYHNGNSYELTTTGIQAQKLHRKAS